MHPIQVPLIGTGVGVFFRLVKYVDTNILDLIFPYQNKKTACFIKLISNLLLYHWRYVHSQADRETGHLHGIGE